MKKKLFLLIGAALLSAIPPSVGAEQNNVAETSRHMMHHRMPVVEDTRTSLNLPPAMKQHQLANMRNHLDALRRIISAISTEQFEQASKIASQELGLTKQMEAMCNQFKNESFKEIGMSFHKSGDDLATVLKGGDMQKSLQALNTTMSYCVNCHAAYKQ